MVWPTPGSRTAKEQNRLRKQGSCLDKEIMQGTMPGARRRGRPHTAWMDNIKTWTGLPVEKSIITTQDISLTFSKIPDICQNRWRFQVLQTSGQPEFITDVRRRDKVELNVPLNKWQVILEMSSQDTACVGLVGCLMSHSTHYRSFRGRLNQLVVEIRLESNQNHSTVL